MSFWDLQVLHLSTESATVLLNLFPYYKRGFVKIGLKQWFLPYKYIEKGDKIYNFEVRPDDTWVITYPRSGTTMTQELVWLVANDMNFDEAHRKYLLERFPFVEIGTLLDDDIVSEDIPGRINTEKHSVEYTHNQPSPRFIKSHMPFDLLPTVVNSTCKIIYVVRNPRDVVVSWYHFQKTLGYTGTFKVFCNLFMDNYTMWNPYWQHVKEAWAMRHRANMMFLFYEDLIKDLPGNITKIAAFFGKTYSDEQIAKLVEHLRIENFRKNSMVNQPSPNTMMQPEMFIRQGTTGGWKTMFTPEIEEMFNKWIINNLKNCWQLLANLTFSS